MCGMPHVLRIAQVWARTKNRGRRQSITPSRLLFYHGAKDPVRWRFSCQERCTTALRAEGVPQSLLNQAQAVSLHWEQKLLHERKFQVYIWIYPLWPLTRLVPIQDIGQPRNKPENHSWTRCSVRHCSHRAFALLVAATVGLKTLDRDRTVQKFRDVQVHSRGRSKL